MRHKVYFAAGVIVLAMAVVTAPASAQGVLFVVNDQVGIGVDTPATGAKLHVRASSTGPVDAIYLENMTGPARINLQNLAQSNTATTDQVWTLNSNGDLRFTAGVDGPEMRLDAAGNLTVGSSIKVGGVTMNVPDYVFEPSYSLMPLAELEAFVEENRRLPSVPSAEQVTANGLNMTEMQMMLLEKVEELTLYTLQQENTINQLAQKIEQLESR